MDHFKEHQLGVRLVLSSYDGFKFNDMNGKKLTKSYNRMLGGVCGGIAEYFDVDPTVVRVAYVLLSVCTAAFPGLLVYLLLCIIIPDK